MKFSTRTRYALRLMVELASDENTDFVSLKDIAQKQGISIKYLEQIVMLLTRAGLLVSSRGSQGGYKLAKKPSEYTPGDIIRAVEGPLALVACLEPGQKTCQREKYCQTLGFWQGLQKNINAYLDSMTLADLKASDTETPVHFINAD